MVKQLRYAAAVVALTAAFAAPAAADTVIALGGHFEPAYTDAQIATLLGGEFAGDQWTRIAVPYPSYDVDILGANATGQASLDAVIRSLPDNEPITIIGVSQGGWIVSQEQGALAANSVPNQVTFITVVDPTRPGGLSAQTGTVVQPPPVTQYDTIVVIGQYDGISDWPDDPTNLLAVMNAIAGIGFLPGSYSSHGMAKFADLSTLMPISVETNASGGTTTTYLVPTPVLPINNWLRVIGVDQSVVDQIDAQQRPIIDSAYNRTPPTTTAVTQEVVTSSASNVSAGPATNVSTLESAPSPGATRPHKTTSRVTSVKISVTPKVRESHKAAPGRSGSGHAKQSAKPGAANHAASRDQTSKAERKAQRQTSKAAKHG